MAFYIKEADTFVNIAVRRIYTSHIDHLHFIKENIHTSKSFESNIPLKYMYK